MRGVVNLLMVLLGASGCSNAVVGHPSPEPLRATEVILLSPMSAPEDTARWRITEEAVGDCHSSSISPANSRARRCFTEDSQVLDPCYVSPFAGSDEALCLSDPTGGDAVRIVITSDASGPPGDAPPSGNPWFLELEDGQRCGMMGGATTTLSGMRMNYACDDGYGYGDVDQSAEIWTLFFQSDGSPEVIEVSVRTVWF